jgi:hypothetical protein
MLHGMGLFLVCQACSTAPEQRALAFPVENRSDTPKAAEKGTETLMAKHRTESLAGTERLREEVCELETCEQALQRVKRHKTLNHGGHGENRGRLKGKGHVLCHYRK